MCTEQTVTNRTKQLHWESANRMMIQKIWIMENFGSHQSYGCKNIIKITIWKKISLCSNKCTIRRHISSHSIIIVYESCQGDKSSSICRLRRHPSNHHPSLVRHILWQMCFLCVGHQAVDVPQTFTNSHKDNRSFMFSDRVTSGKFTRIFPVIVSVFVSVLPDITHTWKHVIAKLFSNNGDTIALRTLPDVCVGVYVCVYAANSSCCVFPCRVVYVCRCREPRSDCTKNSQTAIKVRPQSSYAITCSHMNRRTHTKYVGNKRMECDQLK